MNHNVEQESIFYPHFIERLNKSGDAIRTYPGSRKPQNRKGFKIKVAVRILLSHSARTENRSDYQDRTGIDVHGSLFCKRVL
jgi:hypothetical protein